MEQDNTSERAADDRRISVARRHFVRGGAALAPVLLSSVPQSALAASCKSGSQIASMATSRTPNTVACEQMLTKQAEATVESALNELVPLINLTGGAAGGYTQRWEVRGTAKTQSYSGGAFLQATVVQTATVTDIKLLEGGTPQVIPTMALDLDAYATMLVFAHIDSAKLGVFGQQNLPAQLFAAYRSGQNSYTSGSTTLPLRGSPASWEIFLLQFFGGMGSSEAVTFTVTDMTGPV